MGDNPATGRPFGGRDDRSGGSQPGESEDRTVSSAPADDADDDTGSRAAQQPMQGAEEPLRPTEGVDQRMEPPSPADATEGNPPGGSTANQGGRDQG